MHEVRFRRVANQKPWQVLDVGSGHNPLPEADILSDRYLSNDERAGDLVNDRPLIQCDIQCLPFKDDAFEFVNASQVVEHVEDPHLAIKELKRVSKSGQVDCPTFINENLLFGQDFHNWAMLPMEEGVGFIESNPPSYGWIFHKLYQQSGAFRKLLSTMDLLFGIHIACFFYGNGRERYKSILRDRGQGKGFQIKDRCGLKIQYMISRILNR